MPSDIAFVEPGWPVVELPSSPVGFPHPHSARGDDLIQTVEELRPEEACGAEKSPFEGDENHGKPWENVTRKNMLAIYLFIIAYL